MERWWRKLIEGEVLARFMKDYINNMLIIKYICVLYIVLKTKGKYVRT